MTTRAAEVFRLYEAKRNSGYRVLEPEVNNARSASGRLERHQCTTKGALSRPLRSAQFVADSRELLQSDLQLLAYLRREDARRGQLRCVLERVVLQPSDVQVDLVA